jgi:hypothetical protein
MPLLTRTLIKGPLMFSVNSGFKALPFVVVSERSPMRIVRITLILIFGVIWLLSSGADAQSAVASSSNISVGDQASDFAVPAQNGLSVPWMQLAKLSESDGLSNDWFGNSAAISGNAVVVGLAGYPARNGVYLFEKPASGWRDMTQVAELTPSDGPLLEFGTSVAVDGDTVVVSGYGYHNNGLEGAAYLYVKPSTGWASMTETARLSNSSYPLLSPPVAISGDTVLIADANTSAPAFVYVKPPAGWQTVSVPNATLATPFGYSATSMAISRNGTVVLGVGVFWQEGSAYVFLKPKGGWNGNIKPVAQLVASDPTYFLGRSVAIDKKGHTVVAGAENGCEFCNEGAVYVFVRPSRGWVNMRQTAKFKPRDNLTFGASVAISDSGQTIVAGAPIVNVGTNQFQGAVYVFQKPKSGWKSTRKFGSELTASDGAPNDELGSAVGISGNAIVAGAPYAMIGSNAQQGAAYVFGQQ